jgi:UDP-N-acetyl-2-amino-2-deoxyglucuronate dehydrogenase
MATKPRAVRSVSALGAFKPSEKASVPTLYNSHFDPLNSPQRKIGFAIVGTGTIAAFHARGITATPGAELRVVYNRSPSRAHAFAAEFGGEPVNDLGDLLKRPDVDAVCVTVPSGHHGEVTIRALEAGKHVLCEKPLEITTERIDLMAAAAKKSGRILAGVFQNRLGAGAQHLKGALDAGRFGRLALCSAYVKWWRAPEYYSGSPWKGTRSLDGGGALMNQAIHAVDLLQWLVGMPVRVGAQVRTQVHAIEMEDTAVAWLEFPAGALGVIEAATSCYPGSRMKLEIAGERGTAILEDDRIVRWDFADPRPGDEAIGLGGRSSIGGGASDPKAIGQEGHRLLIADFADSIRTGRPPLVDAREARNAVAIIEAIYRSARTGSAVTLGEQIASSPMPASVPT